MFKDVDETVKRETRYIALVVLIGSLLMQAVFLVINRWDYTVLLGNLLGAAAAVGNFFLMGLTVQKALGMEAKDASARMRSSQSLRMLMLVVICAIGAAAPCFNLYAVVIPLLFPSVGAKLRPLTEKK